MIVLLVSMVGIDNLKMVVSIIGCCLFSVYIVQCQQFFFYMYIRTIGLNSIEISKNAISSRYHEIQIINQVIYAKLISYFFYRCPNFLPTKKKMILLVQIAK